MFHTVAIGRLLGRLLWRALFIGTSAFLNESSIGLPLMGLGTAMLLVMLFGWFGTVIKESESGNYNDQVDLSFRWGMMWFIFSEVMFFAAFFGALFYARMFSLPWLGGEATGSCHQLLSLANV